MRHVLRGHSDIITDIQWNPSGTRLASSSYDGTIRIWDPQYGQQVLALPEQTDIVTSITWRPDGQAIASACADGTIRIWDASKGYELVSDPTFIVGQTLQKREKASELEASGEFERAALLLADVVELKPNDVSLCMNLADLYVRLGDWERAAQYYAQAASSTSLDRWAIAAEAVCHLRNGNKEQFRGLCRQLMQRAKQLDSKRYESAAAWASWMRLSAVIDIPEIREFVEGVLDSFDPTADHTPGWLLARRYTLICLQKPTPELEEKPVPRESLEGVLAVLTEALRSLQLNRLQEAQEYYNAASRALVPLHQNMTRDNMWEITRCEILADEIRQRLSEAKE